MRAASLWRTGSRQESSIGARIFRPPAFPSSHRALVLRAALSSAPRFSCRRHQARRRARGRHQGRPAARLFRLQQMPGLLLLHLRAREVTKRDVNRLAKHFGVPYEVAWRRYTKDHDGERVLKRVKDHIFGKTCMFLNQHTRRCTDLHGAASPVPRISRTAPAAPITTSCSSSGSSRAATTSCRSFSSPSATSSRIEVDGVDGPEKRWAWERE